MGKWVKAGVACLSYQAFTCSVVLSYTIQTQPAAWIAIWLIRAWDDASHLSLGIVKGNISRMRVAVRGSVFSSLPGSLCSCRTSCSIISPLPLTLSVCRGDASSALGDPEPASPSSPLLPLLSASPLLVFRMMDMAPSLSNDHSTRNPPSSSSAFLGSFTN